MSANQIRFLADPAVVASVPPPYPASGSVPQWFKDLPILNAQHRTVKRCPPFLDAMTSGYIIPTVTDIHLEIDAGTGRLSYRWDGAFKNVMDLHHPLDYKGAPFESFYSIKITNPWIVQTPPGYSTLFVAPLNNYYTMPIVPLSGIVETDQYYFPVNLPALLALQPGERVTVRRGTPLVQLIPFLREDWRMEIGQTDPVRHAEVAHWKERDETIKSGMYKKECWSKKGYL